jgi:pyruvate dehydrogenase E2 component (dihydrolipoamide acetyltransferase)
MARPKQFKMPDVGEGLTEADIIEWRVRVGDTVAINDVLLEVETAKAVVELPSPFAGVVTSIHFQAGQTVDVGAAIIDIADESAQDDAINAEQEDTKHEVLVGYGPTRSNVVRRPRREAAAPILVSDRLMPQGEAPRATPPVRKLARELGIDVRALTGTGPQGRVIREDLLRSSSDTAEPSAPAGPAPETRTAIKGVRKATAEAMVRSAFTAPHVTEWLTVDVTRTVKFVTRLREHPDFAGIRVSPLIVVAQAVLLAVRRYPAINSKWIETSGEIVQYGDVNLGIAAATPRGLLVPNVRSAQHLSMAELASAVTAMIAEAREGRTPVERMKDGTFTITNIGVFGIDGGTPILNPGEAAILCFGQIRRQPWEHNGKIKLRNITTLSLSFDHRLVDGELGSRVLADIGATLNDPLLALSLAAAGRS